MTCRSILLSAASLAGMACGTPAPRLDPAAQVAPVVCPPISQPRVVFESNFWLNLHNFLHQEAKRLAGVEDEPPGSRGNLQTDTLGTRALDVAERAAWSQAVGFYRQVVLPHRLGDGDSIVIRVNDRLAAMPEEVRPAAAGLDPALAAELERVAPVYREVWWPVHHRRNEVWIASASQLLARYGGCAYPRVQRVLRADWTAVPVAVHATVYASWFGAYSTTATGPRVTMSTNAVGNLETYGLEGVLHESIHASSLMRSVDSALAADSGGRNLPRDLGHAILFFTAGEAVRDLIPAHVPYAERFGFWQRNSASADVRRALEREWRPWMRGARTFDEAIGGVVRALDRG